jgi:hypothetical protein
MGPFEAKVRSAVAKRKGAMLAIRNESASRVIEFMQTPKAKGGNMPVITGFLRTSGQAVVGETLPTKRERPAGQAQYSYDAGPVTLVISNAKLEDTITFAYTANYARFAENKNKFVAQAAQRWRPTVNAVVAEVNRRFG